MKAIFVDTTNNHNVVLAKGEPDNMEDDVQYYYFSCSHCNRELKCQPQFMNFVKGGIDVMCGSCATKFGFDKLYHYNSKLVKIQNDEGVTQ